MAELLGSRLCGEKLSGFWNQILWHHEKDLIPFFAIHDYFWAHCEYEEDEWKLFTAVHKWTICEKKIFVLCDQTVFTDYC